MRATILLGLLACLLSLAYADLVCGTSYCKNNPCTDKVMARSCKTPAIYRENHAGKCGCCPACVTVLPEGASCKTYSKELGETPSAICQEPMKCIRGTCIKALARN